MYILLYNSLVHIESRIGYASRVRRTETGVVVVVVVDKGRRVSRATAAAATAAVAVATTVHTCVCECVCILYMRVHRSRVARRDVGFPDIRGLDHRKLCTQTLIARTNTQSVYTYTYII